MNPRPARVGLKGSKDPVGEQLGNFAGVVEERDMTDMVGIEPST